MAAMKQIPTSHVCSTDEFKLKESPVDKNLSQICSTDKSKLKQSPVDENVSQICSTEKDELKGIIVDKCSTEEEKQECVHININKQKDAKNEEEYEEYSVTDEVPSYFNIYKCGKNPLNRLDVLYE